MKHIFKKVSMFMVAAAAVVGGVAFIRNRCAKRKTYATQRGQPFGS